MNDVGFLAAGIALVLVLFIAVTVGARYLLVHKPRMSRRTRRILEFLGRLGKPADRVIFRRRRTRRQPETAPHEPVRLDALASSEASVAVPFAADRSEKVERRHARRRAALELQPHEAWPFYGDDEIAAVVALLRSGKVNQWTGSKVFEFEQAYTARLRNGRAIALANGSVALELALRALGIGPGDEVIVTPRTFVASVFCVRLVGATPVFADVDRDSGNLTAATIAAAITPRTRAVIPVHLGGWPADMPAIAALCRDKGILVIEDCAQAHGAEIDGLPVGSFGDSAAFSFCQDKIISAGGEGGLVAIRDEQAYEFAWSFKDHGKDRRRAFEPSAGTGFRWLHDCVGTNWRMTEFAAAIGLMQLDKLSLWRQRRAANAAVWADALTGVPGLRVPQPPRNVAAGYYRLYAYVDVDPVENARLRDDILGEAASAGLRIFSGSCSEVYREAAFADLAVEPLPVARALGESSLAFEVHPTLDPVRLRDRADAAAAIIERTLR